jgi:Glycosyl transferase family 2
VYNGARYLQGAIEALLAQTFTDFELIICDNASTDQTQSICTAYAARDPRVRYHRNAENIGAAGNFNLAFRLARGEYFKWAAHDDLHAPDYLALCVEALDAHPDAVVAHTNAVVVDPDGKRVPVADSVDGTRTDFGPQYLREHLYDPERALDVADPAVRLRELLTKTKWCFEVFGVMRADALRRTPLHLTFYGSDKVLLAAMALQGTFRQVEGPLFIRRFHPGQSSSKDGKSQAVFMSTRGKPQYVPPQVRCLQWYVRLVARSGLPLRDRLRCMGATAAWCVSLARLIVSQRNERGFVHRVMSKFSGR